VNIRYVTVCGFVLSDILCQVIVLPDRDKEQTIPRSLSPLPGSNRRGGEVLALENKTVIVDMREFRSALPSMLHQRGLNVRRETAYYLV